MQSSLALTSVGILPVQILQDQPCTLFINSKSSHESLGCVKTRKWGSSKMRALSMLLVKRIFAPPQKLNMTNK